MFEVFLHKNVAEALKSLESGHLSKVVKILNLLEKNPYPWKRYDLKKLKGIEHTYRIRVGDYRIMYSVEKEEKEIHILKLETRENIYK